MVNKTISSYWSSEVRKRNHNSDNMTLLQEFATDIAACLDSWVGGVKTIHSKLLIQCSDGSRCVINDIEACGLQTFNEKRDCVSTEVVCHLQNTF
jgi:hypothetical protein